MEMCYDGALVMPSSYAVMDEDEMTYVEGGSPVAIVTAVLAIEGASYGAGKVAGKRLYYAGIDTKREWNEYKWYVRLLACGISLTAGVAFMAGLENQLYDMISSKK